MFARNLVEPPLKWFAQTKIVPVQGENFSNRPVVTAGVGP